MVAYHVVRDGVNQAEIVERLLPHFNEVELVRYWSTQGRPWQHLGEILSRKNTFGVVGHSFGG